MPTWKCPHCEEEINHLDYSDDATVYGQCDLTADSRGVVDVTDYEENGCEAMGEPRFTCPECNEDLNLSDIIYSDDDEEEETEEIVTDAAETGRANIANSLIVCEQQRRTTLSACTVCSWQGLETNRCPECNQPCNSLTIL